MNAALVNAIAEALNARWAAVNEADVPPIVARMLATDAAIAAEAAADFVAALPHGYTAPEVLAAMRGQEVTA